MIKTTAMTGRLYAKDKEYEVRESVGRRLVAETQAVDVTPEAPAVAATTQQGEKPAETKPAAAPKKGGNAAQ